MTEHGDSALVVRIVNLLNDPVLNSTALQTARKLVGIQRIREGLDEDLLKLLEDGNGEGVKASMAKKKGDVPRVFDKDLAQQIVTSSDWKEKLMAMEEIRDNLMNVGKSLDKHLPGILLFLKQLLEGTSFRIINGALLLLQEILKIAGITKKADFSVIIPTCIEKLGDEKITFRNNSFKVFRLLLSELYPEALFPYFLEGLTSENWHIREGCLMLIMATILEQNKQFCYNYVSIISKVSKLLSDPKAKIKHVALETLVVIANTEGVSQVLDHIDTDEVTLEKLKIRFRKKVVSILREDGIELPKIVPSSAPICRDPESNYSFNESLEQPRVFAKALREKLEPLAQSSTLPVKRPSSATRNFSVPRKVESKTEESFMSRKNPFKGSRDKLLEKKRTAPSGKPRYRAAALPEDQSKRLGHAVRDAERHKENHQVPQRDLYRRSFPLLTPPSRSLC